MFCVVISPSSPLWQKKTRRELKVYENNLVFRIFTAIKSINFMFVETQIYAWYKGFQMCHVFATMMQGASVSGSLRYTQISVCKHYTMLKQWKPNLNLWLNITCNALTFAWFVQWPWQILKLILNILWKFNIILSFSKR